MAREIAKVALTQSSTDGPPAIVEQSLRDPRKVELAQAVVDYEEKKIDNRYNMDDATAASRKSPEAVQRTDSGVSLEYSMDSSMIGDTSTLGGQSFATDTVASRRTSNKIPTKPGSSSASQMTTDDDMKSSLSVQSEAVPSDEELFAVGWAKAMDPKSGSYYYFTLDRTKIVWDNPLVSAAS